MPVELFTPLFVPGGLGGQELVIILLIAVLLFGANKIPKLARSTGEAMGEFKKGREKVEKELNEMQDMDVEPDAAEASAEPATEPETETATEE